MFDFSDKHTCIIAYLVWHNYLTGCASELHSRFFCLDSAVSLDGDDRSCFVVGSNSDRGCAYGTCLESILEISVFAISEFFES